MKRRRLSLQTSSFPDSLSHSKPFWSLNSPTFLRAADSCGECHEPFKSERHGSENVSWHSPTGHSPLWPWYRRWKPLRLGTSASLLLPTVLPPSPFENRLCVHSHQGLVMIDLPDNFLNPLKLFLAVTNDFPKSPWRRFAGGQERMMNSGPATANQVRNREDWNKSFWEWRALCKIFWHAISLVSVAPDS